MCGVYIEKSNKSLEAAGILCKEKLYTQAVHLFYYSGLQYMLYFSKKNKINLEEFKKQYNKNKKDNKKKHGTHQLLFSALIKYVQKKDRRKYHKRFHHLKQARVDADYKSKLFSKREVDKLEKDVDELINIFKSIDK